MIPSSDARLNKLTELLRRFLDGGDRSQEFVRGEIGGFLDNAFPSGEGFPNADLYEELEVAVACYRPGGGQFMYDEEQMVAILALCLRRLGPSAS